jgi:hypothetical protein
MYLINEPLQLPGSKVDPWIDHVGLERVSEAL